MEAIRLRSIRTDAAGRADDLGFVYAGWLNSFRRSKWAGPLGAQQYAPAYSATIDGIRAREYTKVLIACTTVDDDTLLGFAVYEHRPSSGKQPLAVLHYVYTKDLYRECGVARALMSEVRRGTRSLVYTFRTKAVRHLLTPEERRAHVPRFAK